MNRIIEFDIIRAICILEIVAYWHLRNYFPITDFGCYGSVMTNVSLAGFTLISGYLNGHNKRSVLDFYSSRLKRFFVPYILSYFLLVLIGFNTYEMPKVILDLVGLSIFAPPMPRTLWYISMLSFFYIFTPFFIAKRSVLRSFLFFFLFILLYNFHLVETRVLLFFPFYILGLLLPVEKFFRFPCSSISLFFGGLFFLLCIFILGPFCNKIIIHIVVYMFGCAFLLTISRIISKFFLLCSFFSIISYSSMFVYLFHRFFFFLFSLLDMSMYILIPLMVISTFIICFFLQKLYDLIIFSLFNKCPKLTSCHIL